jgi:hypothetical protein
MPRHAAALMAAVPFGADGSDSPPLPPAQLLLCKLRTDLACIGARNAILYARCAARLDRQHRSSLQAFATDARRASRPSTLARAASLPNLVATGSCTPGACSP